jgi:hypothetical protein
MIPPDPNPNPTPDPNPNPNPDPNTNTNPNLSPHLVQCLVVLTIYSRFLPQLLILRYLS